VAASVDTDRVISIGWVLIFGTCLETIRYGLVTLFRYAHGQLWSRAGMPRLQTIAPAVPIGQFALPSFVRLQGNLRFACPWEVDQIRRVSRLRSDFPDCRLRYGSLCRWNH
jgi:hypothetical protein